MSWAKVQERSNLADSFAQFIFNEQIQMLLSSHMEWNFVHKLNYSISFRQRATRIFLLLPKWATGLYSRYCSRQSYIRQMTFVPFSSLNRRNSLDSTLSQVLLTVSRNAQAIKSTLVVYPGIHRATPDGRNTAHFLSISPAERFTACIS